MSDIKRIVVDGTNYNIHDETARGDIADLKSAYIGSSYVYARPTVEIGTINTNTGANTVYANTVRMAYHQEIRNRAIKLLNDSWRAALYWYKYNIYTKAYTYIKRTTYWTEEATYIDLEKEKAINDVDATHVRVVFFRWDNVNKEIDTGTAITTEELQGFNDNYDALDAYELNYFKKPSAIIIAASNSSNSDKSMADYVCDGTNDEDEINRALDLLNNASTFKYNNGEIILCEGTYNIESWQSQTGYGKYGIIILPRNTIRSITIRGTSTPVRTTTYGVSGGATLNLSADAYNSLENDEAATLLGMPGGGGKTLITLKDLAINIPGTSKKLTVVDTEYCYSADIDSVLIGLGSGSPSTSMHPDFIGIRGVDGWGNACSYNIRNCFLYGLGVAYDIGGEHLIMESCGCRFCNVTYRFNKFGNNKTKSSHPNTLINCCEESCLSSMVFCDTTTKQAIDIIDFNIEDRQSESSGTWARSTGAVEEVPGQFYGTVTYAGNYENYVNSPDIEFWESGSGIHFKTRNLADLLQGSTSDRPPHPQLLQQYFDTTISKLILFDGTNWVDTNGNTV